MIECVACRVIFHKLQPQEVFPQQDDGERHFICPFCKEVFLMTRSDGDRRQSAPPEKS